MGYAAPTSDTARLREALSIVLDCITATSASFEYRLVGTGAALLHGVDLPAADIDLLVRVRQIVDG